MDINKNINNQHIQFDNDHWIENTTAVTGDTSERSEPLKDGDQWLENSSCNTLKHQIKIFFSTIVLTCAITSPILMVILPKIGLFLNIFSTVNVQYKLTQISCSIECKGHLFSLIFKSLLLGIGYWALFFKIRKVYLPRLLLIQTGLILLTSFCIAVYWFFYIVQLAEGIRPVVLKNWIDYKSLVLYADSLSDLLLLIHFSVVLFIEIRHLTPDYFLKVVRVPDGVSKSYAIGSLSIQSAAVWILEKYYTEFPIFNPFLQRLPSIKFGKKNYLKNFKFYEIDKVNSKSKHQSTILKTDNLLSSLSSPWKDSNYNERYYEEYEYERRVKKRKTRLITVTEDAFAHIRRVNIETRLMIDKTIFNPMEVAQAVFPSIVRALQKYLRITRQQPRHSIESIITRLSHCIELDATPSVFLEPFFNPSPVLSNDKERSHNTQQWALVCEGQLPSRLLSDGCEFLLRQGEVSLLCSICKLPDFYLSEEIALPKSNKFILNIGSDS